MPTQEVDARLTVRDAGASRPLEVEDFDDPASAREATLQQLRDRLETGLAKDTTLAGAREAIITAIHGATDADAAALLTIIRDWVAAIGSVTDTDVNTTVVGRLQRLITNLATYEAARDADATAAQTRLNSLATEGTLAAVLIAVDALESLTAQVRDRLPALLEGGRLSVETELSGVSSEATLTQIRDELTRHSSSFARLLNFIPSAGEELREDDIAGGDRYHGAAPDGSPTSSAVWRVVRFYRTGAKRVRYREGVVWDNRTAGWT